MGDLEVNGASSTLIKLGAVRPGFGPLQGRIIFLATTSRLALRPSQRLIQIDIVVLSSRIKWPELEAIH